MSWWRTSKACISALLIRTPRRYTASSTAAVTASPVRVVVPRTNASSRSTVRSGSPAQLVLIGPIRRCSTGFHFYAPVGLWLTVTSSP